MIVARIGAATSGRPVYLSFDIDHPAFAPGTGIPVCGGPTSQRAERILTGLTSLDIVGADIVEVSTSCDHAEITSLAAATVAVTSSGVERTRRASEVASRYGR